MIIKLLIKIKQILKRVLCEFTSLLTCVIYSILVTIKQDRYIVVQAWVKTKRRKLVPNNWGDDLNFFFFQDMLNKKVLILPNTKLAFLFPLKTYVLIGSCIEYANKKNSIVYGSGLMNDKIDYAKPDHSSKILAVRGELTYNWLISNGISCNKVFGDPALLLPLYYTPDNHTKKYRISYIPHHIEFEKNVKLIKHLEAMGIHIIDMHEYTDWKSIPDQVCESDFIISSSLHGIIISEAYKVPNVWTIAMQQIDGFEFKFYDFYSSIKKYDVKPFFLTEDSTLSEIEELKDKWQCAEINCEELLAAMPFSSFVK